MPFRPRYRKRRTVRRRFRRRFARRPRIHKRPSTNTHSYIRRCNLADIAISAAGNGYYAGSFTFSLNSLPNYTEFTALYGQFKINYVKLYFVSRGSNLSLVESYNNAAIGMPEILYCVDRNDNTPPSADLAGMNSLRERGRSRGHCFTGEKRVLRAGLKPSVLANRYESAIATAYTPMYNQWISTADPACPHYGMKFVARVPFDTGVMPGDYTIDVYATYYFQCKSTL